MKYLRYVILIFLVNLSGCFNPEDFKNPDVESIIEFIEVNQDSIFADGKNFYKVTVKISSEASDDQRQVKITTDHGFFTDNMKQTIDLKVNNEYIAETKLSSTKVGMATLFAEIIEITTKDSLNVNFKIAKPDNISVSVDKFVITNSLYNSVLIKAKLSTKNGGVPSQNYIVDFSVLDSLNRSIGYFLNDKNYAFTGPSGIAEINYSASDITEYKGILKIISSTKSRESEIINDTTFINLR